MLNTGQICTHVILCSSARMLSPPKLGVGDHADVERTVHHVRTHRVQTYSVVKGFPALWYMLCETQCQQGVTATSPVSTHW